MSSQNLLGKLLVFRMTVEKFHFVFQCHFHWHSVIDILLRSVDNTNVSKFKKNLLIHKHLLSTGAFVHNINFGNNPYSSLTFSIPLSSKFKSIRCGKILVSGYNTKNNSFRITTISFCHFCCDSFDVFLAVDIYSGYSWQIYYGQIWAVD